MSAANQDTIKHFICSVLGLKKTMAGLLSPFPKHLQHLFLRSEEHQHGIRDQWGNWEFGYSDNFKRGQLWVPECDLWLAEERKRLSAAGVALEPLWPKKHPFAVCLTHDVDYIGETLTISQRWRELIRGIKAEDSSTRDKWIRTLKGVGKLALKKPTLSPSTTKTLETSYKIEKECGITASYFFTVLPSFRWSQYDCLYAGDDRCHFLGESRRVQDVMKYLCQSGFDVGLHGSYFSAVEEGLLEEQKAELERLVGTKVLTTRQHWLHLELPKTWKLQEKAGFLADTTLGFNRQIGYRAGTSFPFFPDLGVGTQPSSILELPLVIQDGALIGNQALEYTAEYALNVVKTFIEATKKTQGCLTFLFHPDIFMKPGLPELYKAIIEECLQQGAWVTDLNQLQRWWRSREALL